MFRMTSHSLRPGPLLGRGRPAILQLAALLCGACPVRRTLIGCTAAEEPASEQADRPLPVVTIVATDSGFDAPDTIDAGPTRIRLGTMPVTRTR